LLFAEDVGALLGVAPAFVYALVRRGELPAVRVGDRYIRFRSEAIEAWIAARESTERRGTQ
jgi:excisionase family DNA binding protein